MTQPFLPLAGIRVVEMSHMIMGPSCGMFLVALGAEVIKVEPPAGDKTRFLSGMGQPMFPLFNRGKKSVVLDLDRPEAHAALDRLLETADVFVDNFREPTLKRAGVDPERLREKFPRLILASHKGFLHGPYENRSALDEVVQMMTGLAYMTGPSGRPLRVGSSANDIMAGLFGVVGIMGALMERDRGGNGTAGEGRAIRVGLFENSLLLVAQHMVQFDLTGVNPPPMPERDFAWPVYDIFETDDGRQVFVGAVTEGQWNALCRLLGLERFLDDPRLRNKMDQINARDWTIPLVAEVIKARPAGELLADFERLGLPFAPINKPGDMYADPHVLRDGGLTTSHMPDGGQFRAPSLPIQVDGQSMIRTGDVPEIGQHSQEIFAELGININKTN